MKLKKILAAVAAAAVAVSTMAVNAFAVSTIKSDFAADDGQMNYQFFVIKDGKNVANDVDVTKIDSFDVTFTWEGDWAGGKVITQCPANGWKEIGEFSSGDDGKMFANIKSGEPFNVKVDEPFAADSEYVIMTFQNYSSMEITLANVKLKDADGNVLYEAGAAAAPAEEAKSNVAELNKEAGFIDGQTPSVTITNADFGVTDIKSVKVDIEIAPDAGEFAWNDWCGSAVKVTDADGVKYYAFGGAQVTWNNDVDKDDTDDIIGGVNGDQWLGTVANRAITLDVPVNGEFTIDIITMWYDSYEGTTYTVKTATADGAAAAAPAPAADAAEAEAAPEAEEAEDEDIDVDVEVDFEPEEEEEDEPEAAPAETEAAPVETEAPVADAVTTPVKTGNVAVASVAVVMAVAGVAAIASKKRK